MVRPDMRPAMSTSPVEMAINRMRVAGDSVSSSISCAAAISPASMARGALRPGASGCWHFWCTQAPQGVCGARECSAKVEMERKTLLLTQSQARPRLYAAVR